MQSKVKRNFGLVEIVVISGDITEIKVDAIVNAADNVLSGGGGVDKAIHERGGPAIKEQCQKLLQKGGCPTGGAVVTTGGNLPARYVIHTAGPVWQKGTNREDYYLARCYRSCFAEARRLGLQSIAFPNISTGVYGFPKEEAAAIALKQVFKLLKNNNTINRVIFACYDEANFKTYGDLISKINGE